MKNGMQFAHTWYTGNPEELKAQLDTAVSVEYRVPGTISAEEDVQTGGSVPHLAVLPHAGLRYSAAGQALFWRRWWRRCDACEGVPWSAVVILSPSHYRGVPEGWTVGASFSAHETPFGDLPGLPICCGDEDDPHLVEGEHGVELLLPGIARCSSCVPVVPVVTGPFLSHDSLMGAAQRLVERLRRCLGGGELTRILWLVSSDFTHYGPRFRYTPYGIAHPDSLRTRVRTDDLETARCIAQGNSRSFLQGLDPQSTVCGRFAAALGLACLEVTHTRSPVDGAIPAGRVLGWYPSGREGAEFVGYAVVEV